MVTDRRIIVSNGITSKVITDYPYFVNTTEGFDSMDVQIVTSQGFGQDGASLLNSYITQRNLEIEGEIVAETTMQMQSLKDTLINLFLPKQEITVNHYYGGKNKIITAIVEKTPKFFFTKISAIEKYQVQLKATDPHWRDPTETMVQIANLTGGMRFPLRIPKNKGITFGIKSSALIAVVYNKSAFKVGMRFIFIANGTVVNPQLFNINTREYFKLNCQMEAGEEIVICTGQNKTVTRNKNGIRSDYIGKIDLAGGGKTFLELVPGDNLFRYGADNGEDMLEVKIYFYNKYVGV